MERAKTNRLSGFYLALTWLESILGFPVALYGLANHLPAGAILLASGHLKKTRQRDPKTEWLLRVFVVLCCYTVQLLLVDYWLGRAAAGYYTLSLPLSGAYLWRYKWLFGHHTRTLLIKSQLSARTAHLKRQRNNILTSLDREIRQYAESLGIPC